MIGAVTRVPAMSMPEVPGRRLALPLAATVVGMVAATFAFVGGISAHAHPSLLVTVVHVLGGLTYVVVGGVAWARRPNNLTGPLMSAAGLTWFVGDVTYSGSPVGIAFGNLFDIVWFGFAGHLVLAYPSGRLETRADRVAAGLGYVWVLIANALPQVIFAAPTSTDIFALHRDLHQHNAGQTVEQSLNVVLAATVVMLVALHYRRATPPARRAMSPAVWASGPMLLAVIVLSTPALVAAVPWLGNVQPVATPLVLASLPVAFVIGLLRSRLAVAEVGHLVVELGSSPPSDQLRMSLARTLHDPSLVIAFRVPRGKGWVDAEGRPAALPAPASNRAYTLLERHGQPVAALIHDRSLENDPMLVEGVAAAASLAIENQRLQADLLTRLAQVRESRARLVTIADAERRRLERDMHDGAQQRLISLALSLNLIGERLEAGRVADAREALRAAESELRAALAELRELASGIRPAILTDAGLGIALEALAERAPVPVTLRGRVDGRLPDAVESAAYFAVAEALTNVAKHSHATSAMIAAGVTDGRLVLTIEDDGIGGAKLEKGSGLRGLIDRVGALDGTLDVESSEGSGTRIRIELPCA